MNSADDTFMRQAIALADQSKAGGGHPFGAVLVLDGEVVIAVANTIVADRDPSSHAEMNVIHQAGPRYDATTLGRSVLYSSTEPCAMCAGAIYWSGISKVIYGCSAARLQPICGKRLAVPCRDILSKGSRPIEVVGPFLEEEAVQSHLDFWTPGQIPGPGIYSLM
jgi:tRNA(Arg) A34 adenosine deaminase TadA